MLPLVSAHRSFHLFMLECYKDYDEILAKKRGPVKLPESVAEAPWSVAEWAVALRFDNSRATVLVLVLG